MSFTEQGADYVSTIVKTCSRHTPVAVLSFRRTSGRILVVVRAWCETSLTLYKLASLSLVGGGRSGAVR